jgi:hypothetical protein
VPPGFRPVDADPGAVSVALFGLNDAYLGFLNAPPARTGSFSVGGPLCAWSVFGVTRRCQSTKDAAVESVRIGGTVRSCVTDDYVTTVGHHQFYEVACLVTSGSAAEWSWQPRPWAIRLTSGSDSSESWKSTLYRQQHVCASLA